MNKPTKESFEKLKELILSKYPDLSGIEESKECDYTYYNISEKKIYIYSRMQIKKKMFFLLHEAGHHAFRQNKLLQNKFASPSKGINQAALTKKARLDHLREEFAAWEIAFELADEFDIDIDYADMRIQLQSCLTEYIEWFKNPKKFKF